MLGKEKIKSIIPQREPFLMIDEIEEYIPGESAICYKDVKEEEWYFKGHFPGNLYQLNRKFSTSRSNCNS